LVSWMREQSGGRGSRSVSRHQVPYVQFGGIM
jgi:hypothetical protein